MTGRSSLANHIIPVLSHDPILSRITACIPKFGVNARKILLGICQDQRNADDRDLRRQIRELQDDLRIRQEDDIPSLFDLAQWTIHITSRDVYRSFISMLLRNEALDQYSGAYEVIREGFAKEFEAGQNQKEEELRLSYQCLDSENFVPSQYSIYYNPAPWWSGFARDLADNLQSRIERLGIIFPQVQRKKNMSRDTCRALHESGYDHPDLKWEEYRTLDLELYKMKTGVEIRGICEMRMAWKFNELKPRFYYCTGGSAYWKSRYMKKIAVSLMECVESTKQVRRDHPEDIQYYLEPEDYLFIWDMASFSSQLSELKHFVYYIAMNLRDSLRCRQNPVKTLDYQHGLIDIPLHELLLAYNSEVNIEAPYSIWRVCDRLLGSYDETEMFIQKNSGMLGVHGNIGLSTAFHGFHLEYGSKRHTSCSMGDDALAGMREDPRERFLPHMRLIGNIMEEKTDILKPLSGEEFEQFSKFVKRRLYRSYNGITIGIIYAFPSLADVFRVKDEYHTMIDIPTDKRILKFVSQVGAFFWELFAKGTLDDEEFELIRRVLLHCYSRFRLRNTGSLPGFRHSAFGPDGIPMAVPSLNFDPSLHDWAEYLWDHVLENWALLPIPMGPLLIPSYVEGELFTANEGPILNVLEDVGCIEKLRLESEWVEVTVSNKRIFRSYLDGYTRSFRCRFLNFCPPWFADIFLNDRRYPSLAMVV